jgi:uncharacterized protein YidB (DUF937 family)
MDDASLPVAERLLRLLQQFGMGVVIDRWLAERSQRAQPITSVDIHRSACPTTAPSVGGS